MTPDWNELADMLDKALDDPADQTWRAVVSDWLLERGLEEEARIILEGYKCYRFRYAWTTVSAMHSFNLWYDHRFDTRNLAQARRRVQRVRNGVFDRD